MNKLLARLNFHFIPIDIRFTLNRFGSHSEDVPTSSTPLYAVKEYATKADRQGRSYELTRAGQEFAKTKVLPKLTAMIDANEFEDLRKDIRRLNLLDASQISGEEHEELLLDVEDREKLKQTINVVHTELFDLYEELEKLPRATVGDIKLAALVEYAFYLTKYLREKRFGHLTDEEYDFDAHMLDYYFLRNIRRMMGFLMSMVRSEEKDERKIARYYSYLVNASKAYGYPFSLDNPRLQELIA